ncbi:FimB/Mfa2 family fimbrial subunit [uncultured Alistipes sp.]|jgi:Protein of unknown function (DUF1812).|uniref:FimB/Mfa2 family fimbrial subunit n=1 Tax=uncultured Alistipes sp. TaxID=538949 RepID=UPI0025CE7649|nr:FimB/Mfa2 family fimbrial subunit [uncultured Alistipes sp.]
MKLKNHIGLLIAIFAIGSWMFTSCEVFNESLPECRLYVKFKYDYNMESADAFHKQVDKVELYVFDKAGKFLFTQTEEGAALATGNYRMEVVVPFGEYRFMAWAGARDSYEITELTPGVTTIEQMKLRLKRPASLVVDKQLERLWYGEIIDVNFTGKTNQVETINLIHDINVISFIFTSVSEHGWGINVDDYDYEIIESNGYLGYDNGLLADDVLSYRPYYKKQLSPESVKVELATMRIMEDRGTRFVVTEKSSGIKVFSISLRDYFEMTLSQYRGWGVQEYFDRQWEWDVAFFLSDSWIATRIDINNWTCYLQDENN